MKAALPDESAQDTSASTAAPSRAAGPPGAVLLVLAALAAVVATIYGPDGSLALAEGPLPAVVVGLAAAGVLVGVAGRGQRWWATWGLGIATAAVLVVAGLRWWLHTTGLVDQHYPPSFLVWVWAALVAVGIAATGWWSGRAAVRVVRILTAPLVVFASFLLINSHYGYWPTMGALLGRPAAGQVSGGTLQQVLAGHDPRAAAALAQGRWVGRFGPVSIPGPAGFAPGGAWVWVPPAFSLVAHADLPVLVMLPGVPGRPYDWEQAGRVVSLANGWARTHGGVAPVMLLVTGNGAQGRDTECVNGPQGNAETYLTRSLPDFITRRLGIVDNPARWGVAGFSEGGTCALGLALEHPRIYGRFVDISGDRAPNFGPSAKTTLADLYSGDVTAMVHHEPLWLLAHHRYPHTEGWFASGAGDHSHELFARVLTKAAAAAGVRAFDLSGGAGAHSWTYAGEAFDSLYPALVASMSARLGPASPPPSRRVLLSGPGRPHAARRSSS